MAAPHQQQDDQTLLPAASADGSGIATLLTLACAPLGVRFPQELLLSLQGTTRFLATPEDLNLLLVHAGFDVDLTSGTALPDGLPVLVWTGSEGPWLRLSNGQWHDVQGSACVAPALPGTLRLLTLRGLRDSATQEDISVRSILAGYKPELVRVAGIGVLLNAVGLAVPLFSMAIYDRVLPVGAIRTLWLLAVGVGLVLALDFVLRLVRARMLAALARRSHLTHDGPMLTLLLRQRGTGTRWGEQLEMMRLSHDVREQVIMHVLPTVADIPFVLLFLFTIAMVAPSLLPVPLVLLALTLIVQAGILPRLRIMAVRQANAQQRRAQVLLELLRSSVITRLTNRQHETLSRWNVEAAKVTEAEEQGHFWTSFGQSLTICVAQLSFVVMLIAGAELVMNGYLTVGALVASSLLCSRAITPALHLVDTAARIQNIRASMALLKKGLTWPLEPLTLADGTLETLPKCHGEVLLANVSVKAGPTDSHGILRGISLRLGAGERWAIVGGVGAGKSTLLHVLAAMVETSDGDVRLDGVGYSHMPVTEIRRHVSLVSQTPVFADVSLRETIAGMRPVNEARLHEALEISGFGGVMAQNGFGLEMCPGPNAERLSGGQRHMLAMAAAIYARPKVLLLDEPTSPFDPDAELAFCARLKPWLERTQTTLVLVTHRDALLSLVDYVAVLVQGRLIAGGDKHQVMKQLQAPASSKKKVA
ncbi:MAG: hypothetical protein DI585_00025 [Pseudomonas fluorescens]|nr:MAG: hypothetical protein DI585_00025 [Pseudomonas fluorescens]